MSTRITSALNGHGIGNLMWLVYHVMMLWKSWKKINMTRLFELRTSLHWAN